jgi:hypothetical protein
VEHESNEQEDPRPGTRYCARRRTIS